MRFKSAHIEIMEDTAYKAGRALSRDFGEIENLQVSRKGAGDFVTSADKKSEKIIIRELQKAKPDYSILSEECGFIKGRSHEYCWIIDPIDGTNNFMHSMPFFCISIALEKKISPMKKEIVAGLVYAPVLNECFYASKNEGAFLGNRRITVSSRSKLETCMLSAHLSHREEKSTDEDVAAMLSVGTNSRIMGAAALELAYVAAGKFDGTWHRNLKQWDIAAGILLVQEAKGIVTDIWGGSKMMETGSIIATNGNIDSLITNKISKCYKKQKG